MTPLAVTTVIAVLWVIGLIIGLLALVLVTGTLRNIAGMARQAAADAGEAYESPEIMRSGVKGVGQLKKTNDLAGKVPGLANAYLRRLKQGGTR